RGEAAEGEPHGNRQAEQNRGGGHRQDDDDPLRDKAPDRQLGEWGELPRVHAEDEREQEQDDQDSRQALLPAAEEYAALQRGGLEGRGDVDHPQGASRANDMRDST